MKPWLQNRNKLFGDILVGACNGYPTTAVLFKGFMLYYLWVITRLSLSKTMEGLLVSTNAHSPHKDHQGCASYNIFAQLVEERGWRPWYIYSPPGLVDEEPIHILGSLSIKPLASPRTSIHYLKRRSTRPPFGTLTSFYYRSKTWLCAFWGFSLCSSIHSVGGFHHKTELQ